MGQKNLRSDILRHRNRMLDESLKAGDYLGFLLLSEQAEWDIRLGKPATAIRYLDRAAAIHPDDVFVLNLRARARLAMADYSGAMEDADMVLFQLRNPNNPGALLVRGDALYHLGRFEHSLVSYYKAARQPDILTRERLHLALATPRAELAIRSALRASCPTSRRASRVPAPVQPDLEGLASGEGDKALAEMAVDRRFLSGLLGRLGEGGGSLQAEVVTALGFLGKRRHFWQQHK
jgi:tetratricopeptide (TPR) repeat protein